MARLILLAAFAASPALAEEAKFEPSSRRFETPAACRAHLSEMVSSASGYEIAEGPYDLAEGDARIHLLRVDGAGHHIWEHRCLGQNLSTRDWRHQMEEVEEAFTVESAARKAEWLKKAAPKQ